MKQNGPIRNEKRSTTNSGLSAVRWRFSRVIEEKIKLTKSTSGLLKLSFISRNLSSAVGFNNNGPVNAMPVMPPPLPPRPSSSSAFGNNFSGGMNFGGYSNNNLFNSNPYYGGYGGGNYFNSYGGGGMFGRPYDYNQQQESDFVRLAEQNSRNAFQSVESVVYAFNSVSQMLESTLNAFYSSFRAVLGVADQFSR